MPGLRLVNQLNSSNTAGILIRRPVVRRTRGILRVGSVNTVKTQQALPNATLRLVGTGPPERGRRGRRAARADVERRDELLQEPGPRAAWGRADVLAGVEDERDRAALLLVDDADPGRVGDVRVRALVTPKIPGGVEDVRPRPAPAPPVVGLKQVALADVLVGVEACVGRRSFASGGALPRCP